MGVVLLSRWWLVSAIRGKVRWHSFAGEYVY